MNKVDIHKLVKEFDTAIIYQCDVPFPVRLNNNTIDMPHMQYILHITEEDTIRMYIRIDSTRKEVMQKLRELSFNYGRICGKEESVEFGEN